MSLRAVQFKALEAYERDLLIRIQAADMFDEMFKGQVRKGLVSENLRVRLYAVQNLMLEVEEKMKEELEGGER